MPDNVPSYVGLAPMLPVTSVPRSIAFYEKLGFNVGNSHTPERASDPFWAWLYSGSAHLMINQADGPIQATRHSASIWIYTRDVESAHAALQSRGFEVGAVDYPFYNPGGEFHVHDPDGYAIYIAQAE